MTNHPNKLRTAYAFAALCAFLSTGLVLEATNLLVA
jgi:hypothetical protein